MIWQEAYRDFDNMTIAELKELLKSKDLPVSGRKIDLIRYLILDEYSDLLIKGSTALKLNYEEWLASSAGFDAINYQDIYS